jgi:hypothetical protein
MEYQNKNRSTKVPTFTGIIEKTNKQQNIYSYVNHTEMQVQIENLYQNIPCSFAGCIMKTCTQF